MHFAPFRNAKHVIIEQSSNSPSETCLHAYTYTYIIVFNVGNSVFSASCFGQFLASQASAVSCSINPLFSSAISSFCSLAGSQFLSLSLPLNHTAYLVPDRAWINSFYPDLHHFPHRSRHSVALLVQTNESFVFNHLFNSTHVRLILG